MTVVSVCCAAAVAGSVAFTMAAGASGSAARPARPARVHPEVLNDVALANALSAPTRESLSRDPQGRAMSTDHAIRMQLAAAHEAAVARDVETAIARRARDAVWDRLAQCETGGNWSMRGSRFSGGLGFYNGTWNDFGGGDFASNAGLATRDQQIVVAERVRARFGYTGWGCAPRVGLL